jgi:hypothetical protein
VLILDTDALTMRMSRKKRAMLPMMKPNMEAKKNFRNCFIDGT